MLDGSDVYTRIQQQAAASRAALDQLEREAATIRADLEAGRGDEARTTAELARLRLGELTGARVADRIDAADREALAQLAARDRERDRLQQAIDAGAKQLASRVQDVAAKQQQLDRAADAERERTATTMKRLGADEDYLAQRAHVEAAAAQAQNAELKAARSETDRDEKRKPYDGDKLFRYLWRRRYRFPEYRAFTPIAALDGWVARLCGYDQAHRDYGMLLEIPRRLRTHAGQLAEAAAAAAAELQQQEQQALAADGVPALQQATQEAQRQLEAAQQLQRDGEKAQDVLLMQRAALSAGNDPYAVAAANAIEAQLRSEDIAVLQADAAATAGTADDDCVRRLAPLRRRVAALAAQLAEANSRLVERQRVQMEIDRLARDFHAQGYGNARSRFDTGLDLGSLLQGVLTGALLSNQVFASLRRFQRWLPDPTPQPWSHSAPSVIGGVLGGILRASAGGHRHSSGGFGGGGGGFHFGGGFGGGGGGGFRTGGGF